MFYKHVRIFIIFQCVGSASNVTSQAVLRLLQFTGALDDVALALLKGANYCTNIPLRTIALCNVVMEGGICAVQTAINTHKYCKGEISKEEFWQLFCVNLGTAASTAGLGIGGAVLG